MIMGSTVNPNYLPKMVAYLNAHDAIWLGAEDAIRATYWWQWRKRARILRNRDFMLEGIRSQSVPPDLSGLVK